MDRLLDRDPCFGLPLVAARARVTTLPAEACAPPAVVFGRLAGDGAGRGAALLESADCEAPDGRRSLLAPYGVLRVEIRGQSAAFTAIDRAGAAILDRIAAALPAVERSGGKLTARFPEAPKDPALDDRVRLRAPSVLDALRRLAGAVADVPYAAADPAPGLFGAFAYELIDLFEDLPPRKPDPLDEPDASFVLALDLVHYDHERGEVRVITRSAPLEGLESDAGRHAALLAALAVPAAEARRAPPRAGDEKRGDPDLSEEAFKTGVGRLLGHIRAGDVFQAVLSRGFAMRSPAPTLSVYDALRWLNPSPYMFHLDLGDGILLGASPETCVKVKDGEVEIRPIAGTAPRGFRPDGSIDDDLDGRLAMSLLLDRKEEAEHAMLVDLARNDVARVSVPGSRRTVSPMSVEKYSHVQHLASRVRGRLRDDLDALHAYRASMNMGTLTGAPKLRAMELIREIEPGSRGFYGGAAGYLLQDGTFDSCIVIRSLRFKDGAYSARSGAGIVLDSDPERELAETLHKVRACRLAVAAAEEAMP